MADAPSTLSSTGKKQSNISNLAIKDKKQLYKSYMPFITGGGLFIPTKRLYKLGEEVLMLLTLMDEKERIPLAGNVIWKTPEGCDGNRVAGIGLQLKDGGQAKAKIETYLAGALELERSTHTM